MSSGKWRPFCLGLNVLIFIKDSPSFTHSLDHLLQCIFAHDPSELVNQRPGVKPKVAKPNTKQSVVVDMSTRASHQSTKQGAAASTWTTVDNRQTMSYPQFGYEDEGGEVSTHQPIEDRRLIYASTNWVDIQQSWKWGGGVCWFHLVRLSVCGQNRVRSVSSTILVGSISYLHILSSNLRRCVACNVCFKI